MKYENKRNGRTATLVSEDNKFKTVMLQYTDDDSTVTVTFPTLKRWWKKVDDDNLVPMPGAEKLAELKQEYTEEPGTKLANEIANDFDADEQEDTEAELTDDQYAQIGKEIADQAKEKAKQVKKDKKRQSCNAIADHKADILKVLKATAGVSLVIYEKTPNTIKVKFGKKTAFEIKVQKDGATYNCRIDDVFKNAKYHRVNNYYLPATIKVDGQDKSLNALNQLLKITSKYAQEEK